jgi:hypothetical protein
MNGLPVRSSDLLSLQSKFNEQYCHYHLVGLSDWPRGEHQLRIEVDFYDKINNGFQLYPAGTHVFEYRVYVDG